MKSPVLRLYPPASAFHKIIYFSALALSLAIFSFFSGYAMIYRHTATAVSYLSMGAAAGWCFHFFKTRRAATLQWLMTLALFTLNKFLIIGIGLLYLILRKQKNTIPASTEQQAGIWQLVWITPCYLAMDIGREYAVWKVFSLNYFPLAGLLFIPLSLFGLYRIIHAEPSP